MAHTACLVCLVSTVSGCPKNTLRRASASSGLITKLEQSTFLRYLWGAIMCCCHCHYHPKLRYDWNERMHPQNSKGAKQQNSLTRHEQDWHSRENEWDNWDWARLLILTRLNDLTCSPPVRSNHRTVIFVQQMGMVFFSLNRMRLTRNGTG